MGSPKRVSVCDLARQTNTNNVSARPTQTSVNDLTSSPSKRARLDGPAVDIRDDDFWYLDGTVVIRVHKTLFRVHGSRLARYCVYFQKLFESCAASRAGQNESIDECPVYHVPIELSANGFKDVRPQGPRHPIVRPVPSSLPPTLYAYRHSPSHRREFTANPPTQTLAISLLTASVQLVCPRVEDLARRRLCELWDATRPPSPDPLDARKWSMAAYMVKLARRHKVPGVLKRAFYELASSAAFWEAVRTKRDEVRLPSKDVEMLYEARISLGKMWREWVMEPDVKKEEGRAKREFYCLGGLCGGRSSGSWDHRVKKYGLLEKGGMDPLRFNVVRDAKEAFQGDYPWCESCLAKKEEAWRTKCTEWWGMLDGLFGL